jgi:hypothetical protein
MLDAEAHRGAFLREAKSFDSLNVGASIEKCALAQFHRVNAEAFQAPICRQRVTLPSAAELFEVKERWFDEFFLIDAHNM